MSTSPISPAADAARESARQDNGQFGTQVRSEADVELDDPGARVDPALIAQYLGDGPELTADEQRMLDVLTSSANHDYLSGYVDDESMLEEVDGLGAGGTWYDVTQIGELLYADYERQLDDDRVGGMRFELHRSGDYGVGSYAVSVNLGHELGYLSTHEDSKYLARDFPRDMSGLRRAIKIAEVIDGDFQSVRARAAKAGLLPDPDAKTAYERAEDALRELDPDQESWPTGDQIEAILAAGREAAAPRKSPWPETDEEKAAFVDWQHEAGNGDTNASFRDWFENPDRLLDESEED